MSPGDGQSATSESSWRWLATRLGVDLRRGEGLQAVLLFLCFFLFITFQYATKSVRQSSYIDKVGAAWLPVVYLAVAVCSYPFLLLYSRFADRVQRHKLIAATCTMVAISMVVYWWLFQFLDAGGWITRLIAGSLYVWISIAYVMNVSQFWSFSNHVFDPRQAKRLFGFIGAGGLLGGIAGGQVARIVSSRVETRTNFLVAAVILLAAACVIYLIHRLGRVDASRVAGAGGVAKLGEARGGLEILKGSRQLQLIAGIMVLTVVVAQIVDIQFSWAAEQATDSLDDATRFFGNFYSVMNISAFLFQLLFTSRIHRVLGVGVAMRILPVTMALGSAALLGAYYLLPGLLLGTALALKVGENGLRYSLDQATRELLFLPVPSKARIKGKAFIDVFVQRGAKGLAAVLLLPVSFGLIRPPINAGWMAFPLIAAWLVVAVLGYREYVRSFRQGLKKRSVDTEIPINLSDVMTLELLVQALGSSDRRQVLQSLDILDANHRSNLVPPLLLYHDDPEVRHRTLAVLAKAGRADAIPLIERALSDDDPDVRAVAIEALAELHGEDVCDKMLPRLREPDASVRAAAIACLANHGDEAMVARATEALMDLLADEEAAVRSHGAKALGAIREPRFQARLLQLLYDRDSGVVREAISAIRRRVARDGFNPIYVPTLVSLLRHRRVKHEARQALVAFGEPVIPALSHFMADPEELVWVRRALPKAIAKVGTLAAATALAEHLTATEDDFQRRQVVEALGALPESIRRSIDLKVIEQQLRDEARRYLISLADLDALGFTDKGRLDGPCIIWDSVQQDPSLVERLLAERLHGYLQNMFGLLTVVLPARDVWAAYRSLTSGQPALRNHALEYLDNTLSGEAHRAVLTVIGDQTMEQKLHVAERHFELVRRSKVETLAAMLDVTSGGDSEENHLTLAALYVVHLDRITDLYDRVQSLSRGVQDPFVTETAGWVAGRLNLASTS